MIWKPQFAQCTHPTCLSIHKELSPLISWYSINNICTRVRWPNSQKNGLSSCQNWLCRRSFWTGSELVLSTESMWELQFSWVTSPGVIGAVFWSPSLSASLRDNFFSLPMTWLQPFPNALFWVWTELQGSENCPQKSETRTSHRTCSLLLALGMLYVWLHFLQWTEKNNPVHWQGMPVLYSRESEAYRS